LRIAGHFLRWKIAAAWGKRERTADSNATADCFALIESVKPKSAHVLTTHA
jgi:hypothetical protein